MQIMVSNCYLVTQKEAAILVDTGLKGFEKNILSECEGKQIKLLVLTHGHIDHVQNAVFLAKQLQVPIAMHEKDVPLLKDNLCREMKANGVREKSKNWVIEKYILDMVKWRQIVDG